MNELQLTPAKQLSKFLNSEGIQKKFNEVLGNKAPSFLASLLAVSQQSGLADADHASIYSSALMSASLDLPINNNLGYAYIVAYNTKQSDGTWKKMAQFQMGAKGFKQLALRTQQYKVITDTDVREGELIGVDRMTNEYKFEWITDQNHRNTLPVIGYLSYFEMNNGYRSSLYMTVQEVNAHGGKYSKTFNQSYGNWKKEFDKMALKTVTKLNLSKNGYLSTEMQRAVQFDQSVIKNADVDKDFNTEIMDITPEYVDIKEEPIIDEQQLLQQHTNNINNARSLQDLQQSFDFVSQLNNRELNVLYSNKEIQLKSK